jgi:hypothetical protein
MGFEISPLIVTHCSIPLIKMNFSSEILVFRVASLFPISVCPFTTVGIANE